MAISPAFSAMLNGIHNTVDRVVDNGVEKIRKCPIRAGLHRIA
jgi:hypothetical protein